jgi:hypothetical protein
MNLTTEVCFAFLKNDIFVDLQLHILVDDMKVSTGLI